jgi:type II secretory pathway pseudopilin PulG
MRNIFTKINRIKGIVFTVVILCSVIALFVVAVSGASEQAELSAMANLERAIRRAAVQAYAIEGFYPSDLSRLVENYGVIIDRTKFIVYYSADMPNKIPIIQVRRLGAADDD